MGRTSPGHRLPGEARILAVIILSSCNSCQRDRLVGIQVPLFRTQSLMRQTGEHLIAEIGEMIQVVR